MKKVLVLLLLVVVGYSLYVPLSQIEFGTDRMGSIENPTTVGAYYLSKTPSELSVANVITAIVVNYRGFDTLGEVSVLFLAATGIGSILYRRRK